MENKNITLLNGNCFDLLKNIKDNSIDLILTDPPYFISRSTNFSKGGGDTKKYGMISMNFGEWDNSDNNDINFQLLLSLFYKKLKDGGTLIMFYDIFKMGEIYNICSNLNYKQPRIGFWNKTNAVPINSKINYLSNAREYFISFVKKKKATFNSSYDKGVYDYPIVGGKEKTKHPTQKPLSLMIDLVKTHTNEGETVLDAFMGSGTTGVACVLNNRNFIGIEINKEYFDIANQRIKSIQI